MADDAKPFVLVPLYMYPLPDAWEPLFAAARAQPDARFVAVVNPSSGPGPEALPDASYMAALRTLCAAPNISAVGYVHCSYGLRPLADVRADIDAYRRWNGHEHLCVDGIFFDETPSDLRHLPYMAALADHTRDSWRAAAAAAAAARRGLVIYNPGVVVARPYFEHPDYVVVFEQSHRHWQQHFVDAGLEHAAALDVRSKTVAIIHSCATHPAEIGALTSQMRSLGLAGIYVTDQEGGGYSCFPAAWSQLAEAVAAAACSDDADADAASVAAPAPPASAAPCC